jgi:hypothetical protein
VRPLLTKLGEFLSMNNVPNGTQGDPAAGNHDYHLKQRGMNLKQEKYCHLHWQFVVI